MNDYYRLAKTCMYLVILLFENKIYLIFPYYITHFCFHIQIDKKIISMLAFENLIYEIKMIKHNFSAIENTNVLKTMLMSILFIETTRNF